VPFLGDLYQICEPNLVFGVGSWPHQSLIHAGLEQERSSLVNLEQVQHQAKKGITEAMIPKFSL
jgi:hypothetical protein